METVSLDQIAIPPLLSQQAVLRKAVVLRKAALLQLRKIVFQDLLAKKVLSLSSDPIEGSLYSSFPPFFTSFNIPFTK